MNKNNISPWSLFRDSCERFAQNTMVIQDDKEFTYLMMYDLAQNFASLIERFDFRIGGVYLPNSAEFIYCMMALNKLEKVFMPLSYQLKGHALAKRLFYSDVELLITNEKGLNELASLTEKPDIGTLIVLRGSEDFEIHETASYGRKCTNIGENIYGMFLISRPAANCLGVLVSNGSVVANSIQNAELMGMKSEDRILCTRSFAIADPVIGDILSPISCGACIVILSDLFHPAIILKAIQKYKVTSVLMVGTMITLLLGYPNLNAFNLESLKRIEFASITTPIWIIKDLLEKMAGKKLFCIYGVPEAPTRVSCLSHEEAYMYPGSVGKPLKGYDIKIYTREGIEAKCGEEGTIFIKSDNLMEGYYKHGQLSSGVMTSSGLRTNDIGYKDEKGFLYLTGRTDDMIMQGGYEVYPQEIKDVLLKCTYIEEAVVFGVDDKKLIRKTVAFVCIKAGSAIEVRDVFKWCRENLEEKKVPKEIHFIDKNSINRLFEMGSKSLLSLMQDKPR